jgi:DNA-binding CsgD family transcriptional regulator
LPRARRADVRSSPPDDVRRPAIPRPDERAGARRRGRGAGCDAAREDARRRRPRGDRDSPGRLGRLRERARAWDLLAAYLPGEGGAGRLPEPLAGWLARERRGGLGSPARLAIESRRGRLIATRLPPSAPGEPDGVLLEPERADPPPAALASLGLSRRQADVLALVARGQTNAEVAAALAVSPRTVQKHLEHIYARLGVRTRSAATARALRARAPAGRYAERHMDTAGTAAAGSNP